MGVVTRVGIRNTCRADINRGGGLQFPVRNHAISATMAVTRWQFEGRRLWVRWSSKRISTRFPPMKCTWIVSGHRYGWVPRLRKSRDDHSALQGANPKYLVGTGLASDGCLPRSIQLRCKLAGFASDFRFARTVKGGHLAPGLTDHSCQVPILPCWFIPCIRCLSLFRRLRLEYSAVQLLGHCYVACRRTKFQWLSWTTEMVSWCSLTTANLNFWTDDIV